MPIIEIEDLDIGSTIIVSLSYSSPCNYNPEHRSFEADIIGKYPSTGERCIAWNASEIGFKINKIDTKYMESNYASLSFVKDGSYKNYDSFAWVDQYTVVLTVEQTILFPYQTCVGCNLPAPHAHPNNGNNFECSSCKFLGTL